MDKSPLQRWREHHGLSVVEAAARAGIGHQTWRRVERGRCQAKWHVAEQIWVSVYEYKPIYREHQPSLLDIIYPDWRDLWDDEDCKLWWQP